VELNRAGLFTNSVMRKGDRELVRLGCLIVLCLVGLGTGSAAPSELEMNGIVTALGDKRVFVKIRDTAGQEIDYMLAEGQCRDGIKLLSVDLKNNVAKFDNHGTLQVLKICPTPELTADSAISQNQRLVTSSHQPSAMAGAPRPPSTAANPPKASEESSNVDYTAVAIAGGNPPTGSDSVPAATTPGANSADGTTAAETPSGSSSSSSEENSWWYAASQQIEQARGETASAVRSGVLPPYPLTPLTPPGTSPELIGPGQAFFNHFSRQYQVN